MPIGGGRGVDWWLRMRLDKKSLAQVEGQVKRGLNESTEQGVNVAGQNVQRRLPTFFGAAFKRIGVMAAGLGATIGGGALLKSIISINREYEKFLVQLETFEGTSDKARAAFSRMERLAASTPFAIEELVQSFITLRAAGLQPTDEMFVSMADTAAAMGGRIDDVAMAIRQGAVGETERLKQFGITARQQGGMITLAYDDITMTVERSAQSIADAVQKIGELKFAGGAAREMATLNGAISNLKDNLGTLARSIGDAGLTEWITDIARRVRDLTGSVAENQDATRQWAGSIIWAVRAILRSIGLVPKAFVNLATSAGAMIGMVMAGTWHEMKIFANNAMGLMNRVIGTNFEMLDVSQFEGRLDRFRGQMEKDARDMREGVEGIAEAWANVSLAMEGALPGSGASGGGSDRDDELPLPDVPDIESKIVDQSDVVKVRGKKLKVPMELELMPVPEEQAHVAMGSTSALMADFFQFASSGADDAGRAMTYAFTSAFDRIGEEGLTMGTLMGSIMSGIGSAMLGGLSEFASGKATQNFMMAAEMLAYGLAGTAVPGISNPAGAFAAAAKFAAVGAAWATFAGLAGAASSGVGGGSRAGGKVGAFRGERDVGGRTADQAIPQDVVFNVFIDPNDPRNPVFQDVTYVAQGKATERHGKGAQVNVFPRSAGPAKRAS